MAPGRVRISFPRHAPALLDSLNRLRLQGKFCDVAVHAGGRVFTAHSSVLAAASPFFHDKLLLCAGPRLALPPAIDAGAFEGLLELIYCGRLTVATEALPGHLLVASALQMWHVVERCSQILKELEGDRAGQGHGGPSAGNVRGHDGSPASASSRNACGHDGSSSSGNVCDGHESIRGLDGSSLSLSSSKAIHGCDGSICGLDGSIHGLDGSSRAVRGHEGSLSSSSSSWVSHGHEGSPLSLSSRATHGREGSLSTWNIHDGDESICGLDGSIHGHDGSSRAIHGLDGSLPSSLLPSQTVHGNEGCSSSSSRTVRVRDRSSSLWNVHDGDESIRGLDGSSPSSSSSKAIHGHDGSMPSSSSSSRANHGHEGSLLSPKASHGREGSPSSSSRTIRSPNGSSHANRSGERSSSSSSSSLRTVRGHTVAPRLNCGEEGPSSSSLSLWGSHGSEGTIHDDIRTIHGDIRTIHGGDGIIHGDNGTMHGGDGTIPGDVKTIHGDNRTIHSDIVTIHGDNDPSSSWATHATTEELFQLRAVTATSPPPPSPSQEILKIRMGDDDDDNDNDGPARILPDDTAAAPPVPLDPPAVFYIKPEPGTTAATAADIPPPAKPRLPSWTPVDLHGNELLPCGGQPAHAPVKLGAMPADGKRFGCACGKRFAARPKRDRHILLTLSLRPFACARCPKRFKLKHHLGEHMKTHRADRGRGHRGRGAAGDQYGPVQTSADHYRPVLGLSDQYGPVQSSMDQSWACE